MKKKKQGEKLLIGILAAVAVLILGLAVYGVIKGTMERARMEETLKELQMTLEEKEKRLEVLEEQLQEDLQIYLPERLYVAVGRTMELYNRQVAFSGDLSEYSFNWVCDIGRNLNRKFSVTGEADEIGEHELKLMVYDRKLNLVKEQSVVLEVVKNEITDPVNILTIGDSLTDSTPWYEEITGLSDGKIRFVGTRGRGTAMHEGRSGFSICDYLTETVYSFGGEGVHPFYNPDTGAFDFSYYKEQTGVAPDVVQIFLGKNGMSLDSRPGIEWLMEMVENIRESNPDLPIYIVQTVYMGDQNGIGGENDGKGNPALNGWFKLEEDKKVFLWTKALHDAFWDMEGVYLIPAALTFDSEYNYTTDIRSVNARSSRTETVLAEGMHPNREGYLQIADGMFSVYCGTMNRN